MENVRVFSGKCSLAAKPREIRMGETCRRYTTYKTYSAGEAVLRVGDMADGMYFVETGTVAVLKKIEGEEKRVSEIGPGQYFGEMGLINMAPRMATVIAMDDVKLAFLDRLSFERLVGPCIDVLNPVQFMSLFGHALFN